MLYKAFLVQEGEGCDYTIGCGIALIDLLEAQSILEARTILTKIIVEEYPDLERALIFEINNTLLVDIGAIYKNEKSWMQKIEEQENEQAELLEYTRLKEKFG